MRLLFAAAVGCLVATAAIAQDAPTPTPAPEAKPEKEKKICRRIAVTGSILGSKPTCHTKSEWADIDARNAAAAEQFSDRNKGVGDITQ